MLCFTRCDTDSAVQPVELYTDEIHADRALRLGETRADADSHNEDTHSRSSDKQHVFVDDAESEDTPSDAGQASSVVGEASSAAKPDSEANNRTCSVQQPSETLAHGAEAEPFEDDLGISALEATTSAHDDWLHRGPFLFDMDFHTYIRFTIRKPRPKDTKICDADRVEHVFLFEAHYALAASHWQQLVTDGVAWLVWSWKRSSFQHQA